MPAAAREVPCPVGPRSSRSTDLRGASSRAIVRPTTPPPITITSYIAKPNGNCTCVSLGLCMIRALIFDFNGVLADDDPIHMEAFRQVAEEEGLYFTDEEYLDKYLPLNDRDCFSLLFSDHARPLQAPELGELIQRKSIYYFQAIAEKTVLFS